MPKKFYIIDHWCQCYITIADYAIDILLKIDGSMARTTYPVVNVIMLWPPQLCVALWAGLACGQAWPGLTALLAACLVGPPALLCTMISGFFSN
jgi:hypothetical protein